MPSAKYCPSFDHLALRIFAPTLCFVTLLAVELQSPKSPSVHDASWSQQGLWATTCGETVECVGRPGVPGPRSAPGPDVIQRDSKSKKKPPTTCYESHRMKAPHGTPRARLDRLRVRVLEDALASRVPDDYGIISASGRKFRTFPAVGDGVHQVLVAPEPVPQISVVGRINQYEIGHRNDQFRPGRVEGHGIDRGLDVVLAPRRQARVRPEELGPHGCPSPAAATGASVLNCLPRHSGSGSAVPRARRDGGGALKTRAAGRRAVAS